MRDGFGIEREFLTFLLGLLGLALGLRLAYRGYLVMVKLLLQQRCHVGEALADAFLAAAVAFGEDFVGKRVYSARKFSEISFCTFDNRVF